MSESSSSVDVSPLLPETATPAPSISTIAELRQSGWKSESVKSELRRNAVARIQSGEPLFAEILGYQDTVFPQVENALLAGHDVIFLGERGQAKTRIIRSL
ncbi:MAG: magnesium chelatase, partial [Microthrixaceae bacterium]